MTARSENVPEATTGDGEVGGPWEDEVNGGDRSLVVANSCGCGCCVSSQLSHQSTVLCSDRSAELHTAALGKLCVARLKCACPTMAKRYHDCLIGLKFGLF